MNIYKKQITIIYKLGLLNIILILILKLQRRCALTSFFFSFSQKIVYLEDYF